MASSIIGFEQEVVLQSVGEKRLDAIWAERGKTKCGAAAVAVARRLAREAWCIGDGSSVMQHNTAMHLLSPVFSMHIVMHPITGKGSPNGQIKCYGSLKRGLEGFICFWRVVYDSKLKKKLNKN